MKRLWLGNQSSLPLRNRLTKDGPSGAAGYHSESAIRRLRTHPGLFRCSRFRAQRLAAGQGVENLRIALDPGVVDRDALEAPLLAVACQLAIVAVHQERVLRAAAGALPRHEMLRHDVRRHGGRIAADLDLEIAGGVAGVEWPDQRQNIRQDGLPAGQSGELNSELGTRGPEIEDGVFRESRGQGIRIAVVEAKGVAMECVCDLISVGGQLG
jgi:hypothetical protein